MKTRCICRSLLLFLLFMSCAGYTPDIVDLPKGLEVRIRYPDESEFDEHLKFSKILPFYIQIINNSEDTIELRIKDTTLNVGTAQLKTVKLDEVFKEMERTGGKLLDLITAIPRSQSSAFHPSDQRLAKSFKDLNKKVNGQIQKDLEERVFQEGQIASNQTREGFVFFKLPENLPTFEMAKFHFKVRNLSQKDDFDSIRKEIERESGQRPVVEPAEKVIEREVTTGKKFALIVGVETYNEVVGTLKYAADDAQALYEFLLKTGKYEADNIHLLLDTQATRQAIEDELSWLWKKAKGQKNSVLFYFAGHGSNVVNPETGSSGYLLAVDVKENDSARITARGLALDRLRNIQQFLQPVEHLTIILDACFSGGGRSARPPGAPRTNPNLKEFGQDKGHILMTASAVTEASNEYTELQHGVFTYYLLESLNQGHRKVHDIYNSLEQKVKTYTQRRGNTQTPILNISDQTGNPDLF